MRKLLLLGAFVQVLFFATCVLAQEARIIDVKGRVLVKETAVSGWQKADALMRLQRQSEIRTKKGAVCRVAFDEEAKNVVTIKENSSVKIEDLKPGKIFLSKGRVFSVIDDLAKVEEFQVRTPTAIAGARGTGWAVGFASAMTSVLCFENVVYISGVDTKGLTTQEEDLKSGQGVDIDADGLLGSIFEVSGAQQREWNELRSDIADVREETALPQKTREAQEREAESEGTKIEPQGASSEVETIPEEAASTGENISESDQKDISSFEKENMMSESEKTMLEFENLRDTTSAADLRETVKEELKQETTDSTAQNTHESNQPDGTTTVP